MELTGKAKEDFNKWYDPYIKIDNQKLISGTDFNYFNLLIPSMQWGVYIDFFDSVNYIIDVYTDPADSGWSIEINYYVVGTDFSNRNEAQKEAIKKINKIYNER